MGDTGQAIALDYTLGLAIAVVLIAGLLIAGGSFVSDQRTSATRAELEVIGQQIAADIETTDRLAVSGEANTTVRLRRSLPTNVAGSTYTVALVASTDPVLRLTSTDPDHTVRVEFANMSAVTASRVSGGPIQISYAGTDRLTLSGGDQP